jgi:hypothetical protein
MDGERNFIGRLKGLLGLSSLTLLLCMTSAAQQANDPGSQSKSPVSSAITGRVINEAGQPLSGTSISVAPIGGAQSQRTSTDAEGNFKAQTLDPGAYRVFASSPGYVTQSPADPNNPTTYYRPGDSVTLTLIKGGVIAGFVTNNSGEPLVSAPVRAFRIRDAEGKPIQAGVQTRDRVTDDRGYYRLYGLQAGSYIVSVGGYSQYSGGMLGPNAYANEAPTYAPASTRDTAAEIIVRPDEETNADIRYRSEPGHSISGRITGLQAQQTGVRLTDIESHATLANTGASSEDRTFQLNSIPDGEYEISALSGGGPNTELAVSPVRRISVKGSDVTGIELTLTALGAINGRVNIETDEKLNCGRRRDSALRETVIVVRRGRLDEKQESKSSKEKPTAPIEPLSFFQPVSETSPNDKGEISLRNLFSGLYRIETRLPGAGWYVKAITTGPNGPNIPRDGVGLKSGDKLSGLNITIAEGGASLRGRISAAEGQSTPAGLRVYLVPAEHDGAENVLRFFEASADDGRFVVRNLAPGKYWLIARPKEESDLGTIKSISQDATLRAKVYREAEAAKREVTLKPCEQSTDYELPWAPLSKP